MNIYCNTWFGFVFAQAVLAVPLIAFMMTMNSFAFAGDGIEKEHFRIIPALAISESYSDNIYLVDSNEKDDYITTITPDFSFDVAIVPRNYFSFKYRGDFLFYSEAENFREDNHLGSLSFNSKTSKGSNFVVGVSAEDTAIQPFSEQEQSKDYTLEDRYADILLMLGKVTEIGVEFSRSDREFDELRFVDDDYTRDALDFHVLYKHSPVLPLLLQYRYVDQDNNDQGSVNTDFQSHTVFVGGRWQPAMKLSGALRVGYTQAKFDEPDADDFGSYAIDTDIVYAFSKITRFAFTAEREIRHPTRSARESGDYNVFTSVGLIITHRRWERIITRLTFLYRNRDYKDIRSTTSIREDDYYRAGLSVEYAMRRWISLTMGYRYQQNNSDIATEEYSENVVNLGITFSI